MPIPSEIQIVPLDFDAIRTDLKRFLQSQSTLKDYNFEGSALATLIDVLAYDAYYHGWYTNFAVNEVFLQTAQIRNSVVSAARQVGYIPRSVSSAVAEVDVTVSGLAADEGVVNLPRYTPFTTTTTAGSLTFYTVTPATLTATSTATAVTFSNVELYEGVKIKEVISITSSNYSTAGTRITIPANNLDTRTLTVAVYPDGQSTTATIYARASSAVPVTSTSTVYFLFENNDGNYEIQFGDNRIGKNLAIGQRVEIEYLSSRGADGNGAGTFDFAGTLSSIVGTVTGVTVSAVLSNTNLPAAGGDDRESLESIKKNAPNMYQIQGRIVTASDARTVLLSEYSGIDSLSVWGGEDNNPPVYGKIFFALKPVNGERFGPVQKNTMRDKILRPKSPPTLNYEFIDPDYLYVMVDSEIRYAPSLTSLSTTELVELVKQSIQNYTQTTLGQFGSVFRYSQLSRVIDNAEQSIQSNVTSITMEKRVKIQTGQRSYQLNFSNPIFESTAATPSVVVTSRAKSQLFSYIDQSGIVQTECYVENQGAQLHVYRDGIGEPKIIVRRDIGVINFDTGVVELQDFVPRNITNNFENEFTLQAIPRVSDLRAQRAQIILVPVNNISLRVIPDLLDQSTAAYGRLVNGRVVF